MAPSLRRGAEPVTAAPVRRTAVVGAAHRINLGRRSEIERLRRRQSNQWQALAWRLYDQIGEVKYAFNYLASTLSRVRIYAAYTPDDRDGAPVPIGSVGGIDRDLVVSSRYELARLETAHGGQPGLLRAFGLNRLVAGDGYLIDVADQLGFYSTNEVKVEASDHVRLIPNRHMIQQEWIELPESTFVARFWQPHPAYSDEPDSSMLGVIDSAQELLMLSRMIRASAKSQINAGILYVADELRFVHATTVSTDAVDDDPDNPDEGEDDVFEEELNLALTEPIDDDESASSVVPLIVRGPSDLAQDAIRKIDLSRPFDEKAVELRAAALDRLLNGLDIPKDIVTGMANVRYTNAQQISEDVYKAHVEPAAVAFCEAYAVTRLRPSLLARGFTPEQVARCTVWYDASEITVAANRSQDADNGHDRLLISDATWRRDHGYTDDDKPDEEEFARRLAQKGNMAPETVIQMFAALIPLIGDMARDKQVLLQPMSMQPQRAPMNKAIEAEQVDIPGEAPSGPTTPTTPSGGPTTPAPSGGGGATPSPGAPTGQGSPAPHTPVGEPQPVTAAASLSLVGESDLKQLLAIERRLRATLQTTLTDLTERALEKAGSRLLSKKRDDTKTLDKLKDVPKTQVAAVLGREAVLAAGFTDQMLANDTITAAEPKYKQQIKQAQAQAAKILGIGGLGSDDDINAAWALIKPVLMTFITKAMFRSERDEYVPKVPMEEIRRSLDRAGGGHGFTEVTKGGTGGAVLNARSLEQLSGKHSADQTGYRWVYGISDNHFEPHLELDGTEFSEWNDPKLENHHPTFPKSPFYHPGDHPGCECDALPTLVAAQPHEGEHGMKETKPYHEAVAASG